MVSLDCARMGIEAGGDGLERRVAGVAFEVLGEAPDPKRRLAADSLTQAELALALEDAFDVRLPDNASFATLDQAVAEVSAALGRPPASGPSLPDGIGRHQRVVEAVLGGVLRPVYRLRITGADRVPRTGPVVLASNHDSLLDIPFLVVACPRPVWFMAKVELFRGALATGFFHALGGFPVRRGGSDLRAIRAALEVLRAGRVLGMYPEGTRAPRLQGFLPGAAWAALATGAPLVPVGVRGTAEAMPKGSMFPRRTHVWVAFGEPIEVGVERDPPARLARAREVTGSLRSEVERLRS